MSEPRRRMTNVVCHEMADGLGVAHASEEAAETLPVMERLRQALTGEAEALAGFDVLVDHAAVVQAARDRFGCQEPTERDLVHARAVMIAERLMGPAAARAVHGGAARDNYVSRIQPEGG